jgi:TolB-like protein/Tfp pilus assembly protein PilF
VITEEKSTLGTTHYLSPEMIEGKDVDHRTDIWSLGVVLYELFTGQLPFRGDYESAIMYAILNEPYEPISKSKSDVSEEQDGVISKCLEKNPDDRYQHVDDLIVDLRRLKRDSESKITTSRKDILLKAPTKRKKPVLMSVILLSTAIIVVAGYFLINQFILEEKHESESIGTVKWENSIAVLPFVDLSPNKDQDYFFDGMTEKILTSLTKLKVLKVIARTSVMKYKNTEKSIPEIGKELGVDNVLEGSIFKVDNRIRVTAQLISTQSGAHIWAEDYERKLDDIFEIQDDISIKISQNLLAKLSPQEKSTLKTKRPQNNEVYEYYLRGRYVHYNKFLVSENMEYFFAAEKLFKTAIKLDPTFADSYASLADLYNTQFNNLGDTASEKSKYLELQEKNIEIAYELDSTSHEVNLIKGWVHDAIGDVERTYTQFVKAVQINPNDSYSNLSLGIFYYNRGLYNISYKYMNKSIELDPHYSLYFRWRGTIDMDLGNFESAEQDYQKILEMEPYKIVTLKYVLLSAWLEKYEQVESLINQYKDLYPDDSHIQFLDALNYAIRGEKEEALKYKFIADFGKDKFEELDICLILKLKEKSLQIMNDLFNGHKKRKKSLYLHLKNHPSYNFLRSDPRFQEILAKHKEIYEENLRKYGDIDI